MLLWKTCGRNPVSPQNVEKRENLWITFLIERPYDSKRSEVFQGFFGARFLRQNASYPQVTCRGREGYPQHPVVSVDGYHKLSPGIALFPSFSRKTVWNCTREFAYVFSRNVWKRAKVWKKGCAKVDPAFETRAKGRKFGFYGRAAGRSPRERISPAICETVFPSVLILTVCRFA